MQNLILQYNWPIMYNQLIRKKRSYIPCMYTVALSWLILCHWALAKSWLSLAFIAPYILHVLTSDMFKILAWLGLDTKCGDVNMFTNHFFSVNEAFTVKKYMQTRLTNFWHKQCILVIIMYLLILVPFLIGGVPLFP